MKNIVLGASLVLTVMSWSAIAEEQGSMHGKAPTKDECKAMAEQHGMKADQADAWVERCMKMSNSMNGEGGMSQEDDMNDMQDNNDMNGDGDMQDLEDGDSGMSDDNQ